MNTRTPPAHHARQARVIAAFIAVALGAIACEAEAVTTEEAKVIVQTKTGFYEGMTDRYVCGDYQAFDGSFCRGSMLFVDIEIPGDSGIRYDRVGLGVFTAPPPIFVPPVVTPTDPPQTFVPVTPVPEPETWALMAAGLGLLGWLGKRK